MAATPQTLRSTASLCKKCPCGRQGWDACQHVWLIRWREGGREVYRSVGTDRASAQRALRRLNATSAETVGRMLEVWYAAKAAEPQARANSLAAYRSRIGHLERALGDSAVTALRPEHISRLVADLLAVPLAPATVHGIYSCLTATLKYARRRGVISSLPLPDDGPGIPTPAEREHDLTLVQVDQIIERIADPTWKDVAEVVYLTGLRWGEVVALRPGSIGTRVVRVTRTASRAGGVNRPKTARGYRVIPLSPRARELLSAMDLPVLDAFDGDPRAAYKQARLALVTAMGPLHRKGMGWHSLRAAHASLLDAAGVPLREAAARMGHGHHFAQTMAYRVAIEVERADTAALDRARQRHASSSAGAGGRRPGRRQRRSR